MRQRGVSGGGVGAVVGTVKAVGLGLLDLGAAAAGYKPAQQRVFTFVTHPWQTLKEKYASAEARTAQQLARGEHYEAGKTVGEAVGPDAAAVLTLGESAANRIPARRPSRVAVEAPNAPRARVAVEERTQIADPTAPSTPGTPATPTRLVPAERQPQQLELFPPEGVTRNQRHDLRDRTDELHRLLDERAQRGRTTAVTEGTMPDGSTVRVVTSSERRLSRRQRLALQEGEVEGVGPGHAEVTGIEESKRLGARPEATAASRPICEGTCEPFLEAEGVEAASPLQSETRRRRRN